VLVLPPFAEEMNKCRRMVTEVCLGLAQRAIASLVIDLSGTGDSGGDLPDADWATWQDDVSAAVEWAASQGLPIQRLLALRLGCALAVSCAERGDLPQLRTTVFWQPAFNGGRVLSQFLRLRIAASAMEQDRKESLAELRDQLNQGLHVEVAGYSLGRGLATSLERILPAPLLPQALGHVNWVELVRENGAAIGAESRQILDANLARDEGVQLQTFVGPPFWASTEVVSLADVVSAAVERLCQEP
jgi:exosortase A-associated hydrolase 2